MPVAASTDHVIFFSTMRISSIALSLVVLAAAACRRDERLDAEHPPPSGMITSGPAHPLPPVPEGTIPRHLAYEGREWQPEQVPATGTWEMSIDHRDLPGPVRWRLSSGKPLGPSDDVAHLTSDLRLVWFEGRWRWDVLMRRVGDRLVGIEGPTQAEMDSIEVPLPPGAPFFTDLSLHLLFAAWPLHEGWEQQGMMNEGRRNNLVVPVRINVIGDEMVTTRFGTADCWIVAVRGPRNGRRLPHWYWVSKRDGLVIMRRHHVHVPDNTIREYLLSSYATESRVLIDAVVTGIPRLTGHEVIPELPAIERALESRDYHVEYSYDHDTLTRFTILPHPERANPRRALTSADSAVIARVLDSLGHAGRHRVETPSDRSFARIPRDTRGRAN